MDTTNSSEKPQRRVEDRKPAEVIDWAAPGAPAVPLSPAATSGDAPDLQQLKALALAATPGEWMRLFGERTVYDRMSDGCRGNVIVRADYPFNQQDAANLDYIAAASPAVVLGLIARIERLKTSFELARANYEQVVAKNAELNARIESAAAPATASGDELPSVRARFEAWASKEMYVLDWDSEGFYCNGDTESAWEGWQARAAVSAATKPTADLSTTITDTDSARKFLVEWHLAHFPTDRTFARYIMGDRENSLAGDFAWQLAKALATKPAAAPAVPEGQMHRALRHLVREYIATRARMDGKKLKDDMSEYEDIYCVQEARKALAATPAASTTGAAQTAEQVRDQALEEAAKAAEHYSLAEQLARSAIANPVMAGIGFTRAVATSIRALKRTTPTHSSEAGE